MIKSANRLINYRPESKINQKLIVIDGKTYKSVEEMSEDVRQKYESAMRSLDQNQNGLPDVFEGLTSFHGTTMSVTNATKIIINGQTYDSLDQLPPEIRAKYEQAMGAMDANKNGIPDFVEEMLGAPNSTKNIATNFETVTPPPPNPLPTSSTIAPESSRGRVLAFSAILLTGLCLSAIAVGVWYFFLR